MLMMSNLSSRRFLVLLLSGTTPRTPVVMNRRDSWRRRGAHQEQLRQEVHDDRAEDVPGQCPKQKTLSQHAGGGQIDGVTCGTADASLWINDQVRHC
jgi:hypothetical protein